MSRALLVRFALVTIGALLLGIFWRFWLPLILLPAFVFFLWLRIRRAASPPRI